MYFRDANGIIAVVDITDYSSLEGLKMWIEEIKDHGPDFLSIVIAANKIDMNEMRAITESELSEFAESLGMDVVETSSKTHEGIDVASHA